MPLPCTLCLTRGPCKNDALTAHTSLDYRVIRLVDKCPDLKEYIFPNGYFNQDHYDELQRFMKYGDNPA